MHRMHGQQFSARQRAVKLSKQSLSWTTHSAGACCLRVLVTTCTAHSAVLLRTCTATCCIQTRFRGSHPNNSCDGVAARM